MKNEEILARVLKVEEKATQEYNKALSVFEQSSQIAEKRRIALLEQKEADARRDAQILLAAAHQRLVDARRGRELDPEGSKRIAEGRNRIHELIPMLISEILDSKEA